MRSAVVQQLATHRMRSAVVQQLATHRMCSAVVQQGVVFRLPFGAFGGVSRLHARVGLFPVGDDRRVTESLDAPISLEVGHLRRLVKFRVEDSSKDEGRT